MLIEVIHFMSVCSSNIKTMNFFKNTLTCTCRKLTQLLQAKHVKHPNSVFVYILLIWLESLLKDKILAQSKLQKALAHNKINVTQKLKFVSRKVENILGKVFPKCFQKPSSSGWLKVGIVWKRVN